MKNKLFLLIICLFLITGCDVKYDLVIDNDNFRENVTMSFLKSQTNYDDVSIYLSNRTPISNNADETRFYDSKIEEDNSYYNLIYDCNHDINTIRQSYFISNCYPNFSIQSSDDKITLSSGTDFRCINGDDALQSDSVEINITTKLKVLDNNADVVNGNTYTWNIDKNNYQSKSLDMVLQKSFDLNEIVVQNEASYLTGIIAVVIIVVLLIIFIFVKFKQRKNNKI